MDPIEMHNAMRKLLSIATNECDYEALCGLHMFWKDDPDFHSFLSLDASRVYSGSKRAIDTPENREDLRRMALQLGLSAGMSLDYSPTCWAENVADVLRNVDRRPMASSEADWSASVVHEYLANLRALV